MDDAEVRTDAILIIHDLYPTPHPASDMRTPRQPYLPAAARQVSPRTTHPRSPLIDYALAFIKY